MVTNARDQELDDVRRELKSGRHDPSAAPQPQEVRKHPTEGERMQFGDAAPGVTPADRTILPDNGKPVPESLVPKSLASHASHHGVLDPPEGGHLLPEGLERKRTGPLNRSTGRRRQ